MKPRSVLAAFSLLLVSSGTARADLVMIQETAVGEVKSRTTMSIAGGKVRTDNGTETSTIMDTNTGEMTTLVHEQKMVIKTDLAQLKAAAAAVPASSTPAIEEQKITPTGKKEKVLGYDCEIFLSELGGSKSTLWVAKDYPGYDKLSKELAIMEKMSPTPMKKPDLPGMTLKYENEQQGLKFVTTLVSIEEKKVDPGIFTVPAGYKAPGE